MSNTYKPYSMEAVHYTLLRIFTYAIISNMIILVQNTNIIPLIKQLGTVSCDLVARSFASYFENLSSVKLLVEIVPKFGHATIKFHL